MFKKLIEKLDKKMKDASAKKPCCCCSCNKEKKDK